MNFQYSAVLGSTEKVFNFSNKKKIKIDKDIQRLLKVTTPKEYKKYMISTNVEYL
jgi:hypothetical protein